MLFLSGCAANMGKFLPQVDHIILLNAPPEVTVERLHTRTTNSYGWRPEEVAWVLGLLKTVKPLLCWAADHEIDTNAPLEEVVATLLRLALSSTDVR